MDMRKILVYDEQSGTKKHGGASTFVGYFAAHFAAKENLDIKISSFQKKIILSKLLFPYLRELLVYPVVFLFYKIPKDVELIVLNSTFTTFLKKPKTKSVVIVHCLFSLQALKLMVLFNKLFKLPVAVLAAICKLYERKALSRVDVIISPREEIKNYLISNLSINKDIIKVIPQFVDQRHFYYEKRIKIYDLIFVGRFSKAKGIHDLYKLARSHDGLKILVITKSRCVKSSLKNIIHMSNVTHSNLRSLYNSSRVLFMPSYSETGPLVTLEAMACGIPVIASKDGGGEFVENGVEGEVYNKFNEKTCYDLYVKITENYVDYSKRAIGKSKMFSLPKILKRYSDVISNL